MDLLPQCLANAVSNLLTTRSQQGHWSDIRSTALVTWAFSEVISGRNAESGTLPELQKSVADARTWLLGQSRREDGGVSWESEAWDTAIALIALGYEAHTSERVDQGVAWLRQLQDPKTGSWYGEIWETTLVTIALLRVERLRERPGQGVDEWLTRVLEWFLTVPSKDSGEFISPHYSGFLAWLVGEIKLTPSANRVIQTEVFKRFSIKAANSAELLINSQQPWCAYTFANAYIAYGLAALSRSQGVGHVYAETFVEWMHQRQGAKGAFEDTEDTALAILALSSLIDAAEEGRLMIQRIATLLPKGKPRPITCFFAYCSRSSAIAAQIKDAVRNNIPYVELMDWRWDFTPGNTVITEIHNASATCQAALLLITKDDKIVDNDGQLSYSPRDNVVFEAGFFAARLGLQRTLLLVERGAKVPSDLGGVIYLSFKDRDNLDALYLELMRSFQRLSASR